MRLFIATCLALSLGACSNRPLYRTVTIEEIEQLMNDSGDSLYILNFWATWCVPCREELPYFDQVAIEFDSIKVFLVSVDEPRTAESKLGAFLRKHKVQSEVLWLSASNPNDWIDRISLEWGGNIPITIFVLSSKGVKKLYFDEITYDDLVSHIKDLTNE